MKTILSLLLAATFTGCATAHRINRVSSGMTKAQVIRAVGTPSSSGLKDGVESLNYRLYASTDDFMFGIQSNYVVKLQNGIVTDYGRAADFREETVNLNVAKKP